MHLRICEQQYCLGTFIQCLSQHFKLSSWLVAKSGDKNNQANCIGEVINVYNICPSYILLDNFYIHAYMHTLAVTLRH